MGVTTNYFRETELCFPDESTNLWIYITLRINESSICRSFSWRSRETKRESGKRWRRNHPDYLKRRDPKKERENARKWRKNNRDKHRATQRRYINRNPERWKEIEKKYRINNREKRRRIVKEYRERNPDLIRKFDNMRRDLGFIPLNYWFEGSEAHHIDKNHIIYIPKQLHRSIRHSVFTGQSMDEINYWAFYFLLNGDEMSQALREAFPEELGGLYSEEEQGERAEP